MTVTDSITAEAERIRQKYTDRIPVSPLSNRLTILDYHSY